MILTNMQKNHYNPINLKHTLKEVKKLIGYVTTVHFEVSANL